MTDDKKDWIAQTKEILAKHGISDDAAVCVVSLFNIIWVAEKGVEGKPIGPAGVKVMLDIMQNLPNNPFWREHSSGMMTEFTGRAYDWIRYLSIVDDKGKDVAKDAEVFQRATSLRYSFISLADYALRHTGKSSDEYVKASVEMHKELREVGI